MSREVGIELILKVNETEFQNFIKESKKPVMIEVELDDTSIRKFKKEAEKPVDVKIELDTSEASEKIKKTKKEAEKPVDVKIDADTKSAEKKIKSLKSEFNDFSKSFKENIGFGSKEASGFADALGEGVGGAIGEITTLLPGLGTAINFAFGPVGIAIAAVAGTVAVLTDSFQNLVQKELNIDRLTTALNITREEAKLLDEELQRNAIANNENLEAYTETYIQLANQGLAGTREEFVTLSALAKQSGKSIEEVGEAVAEAGRGGIGPLEELIGSWELVEGKYTQVIDGIKIESEDALDFVNQVAKQKGLAKVLDEDAQGIGPIFQRIQDRISAFWIKLTTDPALKEFFNSIAVAAEFLLDILLPYINTIFTIIRVTITNTINFLKIIASTIAIPWKIAFAAINLVFQNIAAGLEKMRDKFSPVESFVTDLVTKIQTFGQQINDFFTSTIGNVISTINDAITWLKENFEFLAPIIDAVVQAVQDVINNFTAWINGIVQGARDVLVAMGILAEKESNQMDDLARKNADKRKKNRDDEEKDKKKAEKQSSDNRKAAIAEAAKMNDEARKRELHEVEKAVLTGKILQSEANKQKLEIEKKYLQEAIAAGLGLVKAKGDQYKIEEEDLKTHQAKLNDINRQLELAGIANQQEIQKLTLEQLAEYYDARQKITQEGIQQEVSALESMQRILQATGELTNEKELEIGLKKLEVQRSGLEKQIALEEERQYELLARGELYEGNLAELQQSLGSIEEEGYIMRLEQVRMFQENQKAIIDEMTSKTLESVRGLGGMAAVGADAVQTFLDIKKENESYQQAVKSLDSLLQQGIITQEQYNQALSNLNTQKAIGQVQKYAEVAKQIVNGINDLVQEVSKMQVAALDREIESRQANIQKIEEETAAIIERDRTIFEIENKLAENRIEELEALQEQLPEAQRERAKQDIESEKAKITDLDKIQKQEQAKVDQRRKHEEQAIKRAEQEKRQIQARAFDMEKAAKITSTIITGALAAIQAFSSLAAIPIVGPALGGVAAGVVAAFTAVQVGLIAAQPNPYRLKKGVKDTRELGFRGAIEGQDSIPALLMPGESVLDAKKTQEFRPAINAIFDRKIPANILNEFVQSYINGSGKENSVIKQAVNVNFDSKSIVSAIEKKESVKINIDEHGFEKYIQESNTQSKVKNRKLRIDV